MMVGNHRLLHSVQLASAFRGQKMTNRRQRFCVNTIHFAVLSLCIVACLALLAFSADAQELNPNWFLQMRYRTLGPEGNRADAIVGEPGNPMVDYIGAASGGIFKTTDGGLRWTPIFDKQDVMSIGSLAIASSAHNIIWAGTGEAFYNRIATSIGDGIYKSTDGGTTWKHMGLENTGRIARIVIDPTNPDIVFAAAVGSGFAPSQDRGVFRTTDGGKTWQRVLFVDENTGAADVAMDPHDPQTLLAGTWQLTIHTWDLHSGGPGSGIFISHDGGSTWTRIVGHGLPDHPVGKTAVAIAPSDGQRMYALVQDKHPGFYRSDDGGQNWRLVNQNDEINERSPYYNRFTVDPVDEDRIYFVSVGITRSLDGGATDQPFGGGGDNHDFWIDPTNPNRMMIAHDGGASITLNRGVSWQPVNLPIAQLYHVTTDNAVPYFVYANEQDNGSWRISSNSWGGGISAKAELRVGGCESGFTVPDKVNNEIVYSGCYDGGLDRFDLKTLQTRDVKIWPVSLYGWTPADVKYRWNWTFPIAISPNDHNIVYVGSQYVHETTDGGASWKEISPDLTRNDKSHEQNSGGVSNDNLFTFDGATLWSIAESPEKKGLIWAGSNDGLVHVTQDGGAHWADVTGNIPNLPHWAIISNIEPSHFDAGTAYLAADDHLQGGNQPLIYKTTDYGATWTQISAGIPQSVFSYISCVKEDPKRPGLLFASDQNSVYFSINDGKNWSLLQSNMPHAPASWIDVQGEFGDLVVSTYGRGIWLMDDITPLRELNSAVLSSDVHLFSLRPAYRWKPEGGYGASGRGAEGAQPPPYGADINYFIKSGPVMEEQPQERVSGVFRGPGAPPQTENSSQHQNATITILDADGRTVRVLHGTTNAGINRVWWDLRYEAPHQPLLVTSPPDAGWVATDTKGRRIRTWDLDFSYNAPVAPPGKYTVRLAVNGQTFEQPLEIIKDPRSAGTLADIREQIDFGLQIRDSMNTLAGLIGRTEWIKRQADETIAMLGSHPQQAQLVAAARDLEDKATKTEEPMFDVYLTGAREDQFRNPDQLWEWLATLNREITEDSADFPPTEQQLEVYKMLTEKLKSVQAGFDALCKRDVQAFNRAMRQNDLAGISVPPAAALTFAPPQRSMFGDFPIGADAPANPDN
jgi:photosystem II stability/assembly factor-like uncharacterized protein